MLRGDSAEAVLRKEEALLPVLDELQASSAISGAEIALAPYQLRVIGE